MPVPMPAPDIFPEENLLLTAEHGLGFFPAYPDLVLKRGSYKVVRKLGSGQSSSTWLVVTSEPE
jgi:serine/threonine-protein kinase SRPK3